MPLKHQHIKYTIIQWRFALIVILPNYIIKCFVFTDLRQYYLQYLELSIEVVLRITLFNKKISIESNKLFLKRDNNWCLVMRRI